MHMSTHPRDVCHCVCHAKFNEAWCAGCAHEHLVTLRAAPASRPAPTPEGELAGMGYRR